MGEEGEKPFICDYCGKDFALAAYRAKHVKRNHNDILKKTMFVCEMCNKEFIYKSSMQRHMKLVHFPGERFSCDICNYTTVRKYDLTKHINTVHNDIRAKIVKNFKCAHCTSEFTLKSSLSRHEKIIHKIHRFFKSKTYRKCPLCTFSSSGPRRKEINDHFKNEHNLKMEWQQLNFQNKKEFNNWKYELEIKNNISFVKGVSYFNPIHYFCHRSGKYKSFGTNKRRLKMAGSCKINAHCPCEIVAKTEEDGRISVCYLPTHVGHKNELRHLRLRKRNRRNLTAKFLSKSPCDEISKGVQMSLSNNELKRINLVNNKDLDYIEKSFNIDKEAEKHPYDPVSIEAWVHELMASQDTSQLIYKPQGKYDPEFPNLNVEDFVLIFMTEAQKLMLLRFGKEIICIDSTHGGNKYNFQLYTLLTINKSREGFPCAFMFSNRGDAPVMSLFFQSIKDKVGQIRTSVFMSDVEDTFYFTWTNIMGPAVLRLFCTWHVLKAWRSNLNKIKNKEKKEEVYKMLKTIMYELNPLIFNELLNAATTKLDGDTETNNFSIYFQEQYVKGEAFKNWAYCYRAHANINTNISLDNFNRVLKYCYLRGRKIQRLEKTLCAILNLIRDNLFDYVIKLEKRKLFSKLHILRRRHKTAIVTYTDKDILPDGDNKWKVISSTGLDLYTVRKVKDCNNCQLQCFHCDSCFHEYICTCIDNSIKTNMCKHIHAVSHLMHPPKVMTSLPDDDFADDYAVDHADEQMTFSTEMKNIDTEIESLYQEVMALSTTPEQPLQVPVVAKLMLTAVSCSCFLNSKI